MRNLIKKESYFPSIFSTKDEFLTPFDTLFDKMMSDAFPTSFGSEFGLDFFEKGSYPKCDIIDFKDKVRIEFEIPGVEKSDISIEMKDLPGVEGGPFNKCLTISGKKQAEYKNDGNTQFLRRELKRSSFQRSFTIHDNLNSDDINAEFTNGVLIIDIPKKEPKEIKNETKKIDIK